MNILAYVHLRNISGATGAGRVARNIVEGLSADNRDRIVVLADHGDYRRIIPDAGSPWDRFEYRFFERETSLQQAIWIALQQPKAENYWADAEIVYCTGESYVPVRKARLAVTVHDAAYFESDVHPANWQTWKQRMKWQYLYRLLSKKADRLITVSNFSAERLAYFFPQLRDRLRVVPNGITDRFFSPVSAEGEHALAELELKGRRFVMLPRGLHYRKNADLVINTWPMVAERFPDLQLVISGHCDPTYARRAMRLGPTVKLTGFVGEELLCSLYHSAEVIWFPTRYEGFGLPPLEAMACGTPVVASDTSSVPEVTGGAAMLVSPASIDDNLEAISSVLRSEALAKQLSDAGVARSRHFTWSAAARLLRDHFAEIV